MFKECKHSDCAVCKNIKEREIFKQILENIHPEVYICPYAAYSITNCRGGSFVLPSLEFVRTYKRRYRVTDVYTTFPIELNKENLKIVCTKDGECDCKPYVASYTGNKKGDR